MVEERCEICGKETRRVLFKDAQVKVYICSRKCEYEYFDTLYGKDKAVKEVLLYLDKKIAKMKKYELCSWTIALLGAVIAFLGIALANIQATKEQTIGPLLFVVGVAPITGSLLLISQLSREKQKLVEKREQLGLAYSY